MFSGAPLINGPGNGADLRYTVFVFLLFPFLFCFLKHHSTKYVRKISKVRCLRAWPTYHKAELRWGRAFIAMYMWIMCTCSNRLDERKLRWADVYPSEVVFCFVRFSVEVF